MYCFAERNISFHLVGLDKFPNNCPWEWGNISKVIPASQAPGFGMKQSFIIYVLSQLCVVINNSWHSTLPILNSKEHLGKKWLRTSSNPFIFWTTSFYLFLTGLKRRRKRLFGFYYLPTKRIKRYISLLQKPCVWELTWKLCTSVYFHLKYSCRLFICP